MNPPKILIIIPALNEASVISRLIREIKAENAALDVVVVNDGSSDETADRAEKAGASVANLPYNLGIGGAVQTGYRIALEDGYDIAVQIDGDAQHNPAFLNDVMLPVLNNQLDLCIGSRFLNNMRGFQSTIMRRFGIRFFSVLLSTLTGTKLSDPTSGFRACNRKLIEAFSEYYPVDFPEPEAVHIAKRLGARIGEVPVRMRKRLGGISSIRYFATLYYMVKVTLAILIDILKKRT